MSGYIVNYTAGEKDFARPWGGYVTVEVGHLPKEQGNLAFCDKVILVDPGKKLSVQKHVGRQEDWSIAAGEATIHVGKNPNRLKALILHAGEHIHIPVGTWHYVQNTGPEALVIKERQSGIYLHEQDNIRRPTAEDPRTTNVEAMKAIRRDIKARHLEWPKAIAGG